MDAAAPQGGDSPAAPGAGAAGGPVRPASGRAGVCLKAEHYREVLEDAPDVGWFEVHPENYMIAGGPPLRYLEAIRRDYPLSLHGVGMSLGSREPPCPDHLDRLAALAGRIEPFLVSEHLSWSRVGDAFLADLLPVPMTREALRVVAGNVSRAQDRLGRAILIENPSTYLGFRGEEIPEPEFLGELARRTGCGLLLDVNNLHVCAVNHGFDPAGWLDALDAGRVEEIHLAGHSVDRAGGREVRIDDHGSPVIDDVWDLYRDALGRLGPTPTLIERDANLPPLAELLEEARRADRIAAAGRRGGAAGAAVAVRTAAGPPPGLGETQRAFRAALTGGGDAALAPTLAPAPGPEQRARIDIHRNNVACALIRSLEGLYPAMVRLTGASFFARLAGAYARAVPPAHGRLVEYGFGLPEFVEADEACAAYPWLADVARLELAWHRAYIAAEAPTLGVEALADVPPARMGDIVLAMHPSCQWLSSRYPVSEIWRVALDDDEPEDGVDVAGGAEWLLVARPRAEVELRRPGEAAYRFGRAVAEGRPLGAAWEEARAVAPDFDLTQHLGGLFAGGAVAGVGLAAGEATERETRR